MFKHLRPAFRACIALAIAAIAFQDYAVAASSYSSDDKVDAASRSQVVNALADKMRDSYVFPEVGEKLASTLRRKLKDGGYDSLQYAVGFASALTYDLQAINHDRHLVVMYGAVPFPSPDDVPTVEDEEVRRKQLIARNYGVVSVRKLPGNIGYLRMDSFELEKYVDQPLAAAMTQLADTTALIIDLRTGIGGELEAVNLLCSYLYDTRTHLLDEYLRVGERTTQIWTHDKVSGPKFGQAKPVYLLTSHQTFSAPEMLSYTLQALKRATLVGEVTGGGANGGDFWHLNSNFYAMVPDRRTINPVTKSDWEGTGVLPDVAAPAESALLLAQKLALQTLTADERDQQKLQVLRERLSDLDAQLFQASPANHR